MACHAVNGLVDSLNRTTRAKQIHIAISYVTVSHLSATEWWDAAGALTVIQAGDTRPELLLF